MNYHKRGITSIILALTMVIILTSAVGLAFRRLSINQQVSQQNIVAQQAFQAAYTGVENWQYQLRTAPNNNQGKRDIPQNGSGAWKCMQSGDVIYFGSSCPNAGEARYRVECDTCGPFLTRTPRDGDDTNDRLLSIGQKVYKDNIVTRAISVNF